MNILVTGTRAPVALDICRQLSKQGFRVVSADSMNYPLSRFSSAIYRHITLPKPNVNPKQFYMKLSEIIQSEKIDWLLPTCEEVFFLAHYHQKLSRLCNVFFDNLDVLKPLHDKFLFNQLTKELPINTPSTQLIHSKHNLFDCKLNDYVLKPVFSRFGDATLIKPSQKQLNRLTIDKPYVVQEFISGKEYCLYAMAYKGNLLAHSIYHPKYKAGRAGIYFEPANNEKMVIFASELIKTLNYTGQISFDFMVNRQGIYVLECNPRATSGYHLISDNVNWSDVFNGKQQLIESNTACKMVGFAMCSYGLKYLLSKNARTFLYDFHHGQDVLTGSDSPFIKTRSMRSLFEITARMIKEKKNFKNASTDDIEYNGEVIR